MTKIQAAMYDNWLSICSKSDLSIVFFHGYILAECSILVFDIPGRNHEMWGNEGYWDVIVKIDPSMTHHEEPQII